ncbi:MULTISPECIES: bifunctional diguanylate cyclase/phosphodiesterase [unclassified Caulobacter]|jgi:diguanylate cyclase (GGDEF)-like protein|uniref:putative bifunctional diguanylate cyclase/phosphodiesterase n=1 Tax=unclassified Caulobacter TaxID=2648921 RepID=UPI00078450EE|nr:MULTISPECIES: EAL domain-containing protein [unclassified Caulobacter]AZS20243.1 EAL domain-containing protein [Caulobacter sp. FWC26]
MFTLRDTVSFLEPAREDHLGKALYDRFREEPDTLIIPVLDRDDRPIGLVERNAFFLRMAAEYGRALYANRPISTLMDREPLVVDANTELAEFTSDSLSYRASDLLRGFIVTDNERYLGVGTVLALLQASNETNRRGVAQIARLAHYDPLTDLPNRVLFQKSLSEALARRSRKGDALAVHFVDLDRFKTVNDTLGHPLGDALLKIAAERLRGCVREGDTVARLGGDEFAVVQTGLDDANGATRLAARIVEAMSAPFDLQGHQVVIGASVGVSLAPTDGDEADELLKKADMALYRAKADGRGAYHFFERAMDEQLQARRALELDLRRAVQAGEFELVYQPLYHLGDERVTGCEALLRWRHPERGTVSPADFIPLAEEIGLIVPLGEWVLRRACAEAANWPDHVRLAVNLSPAQFRDRGLVRTVISALASSGLAAERLELEITESVLLQDSAANMTMLHDLKALGVRISMDDFGTGYSSLSYLRSFPFDKIKIDQTFVRDILHDSDALAIIKAVLDLGASMGVTTTAEGVETLEQLNALRGQGCAEIQGYFISRPAPASEIAKMLGITETSATEAAAPLVSFSQRETEGPAPQAWEGQGLQLQTERRHAG